MRIELDSDKQVITVDGTQISLDLLRSLANPSVGVAYTLERNADVVTCRTIVLPTSLVGHA